MIDLDRAAAALAVLVDHSPDGFRHLATAWSIGPEEWVTAWADESPPEDAVLLSVTTGALAPVSDWEWDAGVAACRCPLQADPLPTAGASLRKRQALRVVGYPSVIDHPAFNLSPGSLDAERYIPYLCPWTIDGHLALFSAEEGWLTGRFHHGMAGAPVIDVDERVIGMVLGGHASPEHPSLTRFRRLA